jgi:adiponectin receptor
METLIDKPQVPEWYLHNPHILTGYRPVVPDTAYCIRSGLTGWHNESVNIWSHLLGFVAAFVLGIVEPHPALKLYFLGAMVVMGLSVGSHTMMNHSESVCTGWLKGDYIGIIVFIGTFMCSMGYILSPPAHGVPETAFYLATLAVCVYLVWFTLYPNTIFTQADRRIMNFALPAAFIMLAYMAYAGIAAYRSEDEAEWPRFQAIGGYFLLLALVALSGVCVYKFQNPERAYPVRFDLLGASHQIWHLVCIVVIFAQYAILRAFLRTGHGLDQAPQGLSGGGGGDGGDGPCPA